MASLYEEQGRYTEAETLLQRALAMAEETFGATHPVVAISFNNLADVYRGQGHYWSFNLRLTGKACVALHGQPQ